MRLIDADELLKKEKVIQVKEVGYTHRSIDPIDVIEAPTIDAELIARCKDCFYWSERFSVTSRDNTIIKRYCMVLDFMTRPNFYCPNGEKTEVDE